MLRYIALIFFGFLFAKFNCQVCPSVQTAGTADATWQRNCDNVTYARVMTDTRWAIGCCGVVIGWQVSFCQVDFIDLQIWRAVDLNNGIVTMIGMNQGIMLNPASGNEQRFNITNQAQQIPVRPGDLIGWYTYSGDVYYGNCTVGVTSATCTATYLEEEVGSTLPAGYEVVGQQYQFSNNGTATNTHKDFAIQAIVDKSSVPAISNLPAILNNIPYSTNPGTKLAKIKATDANTLEKLSFSIVAITPNNWNFVIDPNTGDFSTNGSLAAGPYNYAVDVGVTDGCQTTTATLQINVTPPPTTTVITTTIPPTTTTTSFIQTQEGQLILGLSLAGLVLAAILAGVTCYLCYKLGALGSGAKSANRVSASKGYGSQPYRKIEPNQSKIPRQAEHTQPGHPQQPQQPVTAQSEEPTNLNYINPNDNYGIGTTNMEHTPDGAPNVQHAPEGAPNVQHAPNGAPNVEHTLPNNNGPRYRDIQYWGYGIQYPRNQPGGW